MSSDGPLHPRFQSLIDTLLSIPEMKGAYVYSGYRNNAHQNGLFQAKLRKTGGNVEKARHWVAPPGHSNHNHAIAADIGFNAPGQRTWLRNASKSGELAKMGLQLRMSHEGWHVEPLNATGDNYDFFNEGKDAIDQDTSLPRPLIEKWGPARTVGYHPQQASTMQNPYSDIIKQAAAQYGVPAELLTRMMSKESSGNPNAVSKKGAVGLIQLMPDAAREVGVTDRSDPKQNIFGAAQYLRKKYDAFGNWKYATAAYNAGEAGINRAGDPSNWPTETQNYVARIKPEEFDAQGAAPTLARNGVVPMMPQVDVNATRPIGASYSEYPTYNPQITQGAPSVDPAAVPQRTAAPTAPSGISQEDWEKRFKMAAEEQAKLREEERANQLPPGYGDMGMFKAGFAGMSNPGYQDVSQGDNIQSLMQMLLMGNKLSERTSSFNPALFGGSK